MIRLALFILTLWVVGACLLWLLQSDARRGGVIDVGPRDRMVALFWLPLGLCLAIWSALVWAHDRGRCA